MLISKLLLWLTVSVTPSAQADQLLADEQKESGVTPVHRCDDDTFLRRVTLDLIGRIPTRDELARFRKHPDRAGKIDELLADDAFPSFWSEVWTASLVGYQTQRLNVSREPLRAWIEQSFRDDVGYDKIVRQLISAEGESAFDGPVNFLLRHRQEPAVKVSRMFLGVRLDCARCHDHPFDRWTREDFDRFNQFFQSVQYATVSQRNVRLSERPRNANPDDRPRFLTGASPQTSRWRDELALFVATCKPFARNFANRVWYQLLGSGIVDPPDDFVDGAAAAPKLLDFLANQARESEFELRHLVRLICNTEAYQRESGHAELDTKSHRLFASYRPKPMSPDQIVNSLGTALDRQWTDTQRRQQRIVLVRDSLDADFSQTWEYRDTVQDVMTELVQRHSFRDRSVLSIYEKILSRKPTAEEYQMCRDQPRDRIVFALLHSNEFRFNH